MSFKVVRPFTLVAFEFKDPRSVSWKVPPPPQLGFSAQHLSGAGAHAHCAPSLSRSVSQWRAGPGAVIRSPACCALLLPGDLKSVRCWWCWGQVLGSGWSCSLSSRPLPQSTGAAACAGRPPSRLAANSKKCFQQNYETAVRTFISKSRLDRGTFVTVHSSPCNVLTVTTLISPEDTWLS